MKKKFQLIDSLSESKIFRSKNHIDDVSGAEVKDLFYLYVLSLYVLSKDSESASWARNYASKTKAFGNFEHFRTSATDLYILAYIISGNHDYGNSSQEQFPYINQREFLNFLRVISGEMDVDTLVNQYLMKLERNMRVSNSLYKSLRRKISNWDNLKPEQQKDVHKRLYKYIKSIKPQAEMLQGLKPHVGRMDRLSGKQKAALGVGVAAAGFAAGYKAGRNS